MNENGQRRRVVIEGISPEIDCGRFPIKRAVGETVTVETFAFTDGHDSLAVLLLDKPEDRAEWRETRMEPLINDRWRGEFHVDELGTWVYTVCAWNDRFRTWWKDFRKRVAAGQNVHIDRLIGAELVDAAVDRADSDADRVALNEWSRRLRQTEEYHDPAHFCDDEELGLLMDRYSGREFATKYHRELHVTVEAERARYGAWYEMFPRSAAAEPGRHGTFRDVEARLPYVASMGFDVLYLPPIHPIGHAFRKGKNNAPAAEPGDVGSPWAIGAVEGGHKAIHPELGTLEDFRRLVESARGYGIEVALDFALQCSPDHPYVKEHPGWFQSRPDGTIQYAENPPKKYQDIYPIHFETDDWRDLWNELKSIIDHWMAQGVRIFRVDNPHTKPFPFWEWLIAETRQRHPDVVFLSEAFTRPAVMYRLAKLGFSQSYTYFTWRRSKQELTDYITEVTRRPVSDVFRPNLWPNTPDILTEQLQVGGRNVFMARLVLGATLGASYGIYGPAFELCEHEPREFGSEEYLNSEKYQLRHWNIESQDSLKEFIALVNQIRRENPALQSNDRLQFHDVSNDQLICYSKSTADLSNLILVVVNLDPNYKQSGFVELPLEFLDLDEREAYQMHDLLSGARYLWYGRRNYLELDPHVVPAHIFRIRRRVRSERDFDYYL